jgi:hypothetical protein
MIKFTGHYEAHVDMFCHCVTSLDFVLKGNPFCCLPSLLFYVIGVLLYVIRVLCYVIGVLCV